MREREREKERESVCVCVRERERIYTGMPDMSAEERETRAMRRAKREPHATCFGGITPIKYDDTPPEWMTQDVWLGIKDIDAC